MPFRADPAPGSTPGGEAMRARGTWSNLPPPAMAQNDLNPKNQGFDDSVDAIPVSGIKPMWIGVGVGVVAIALGATFFVKMSNRGHVPKADDLSDQAAMDQVQRNAEAAKEQKEHLLVTQRSLDRLKQEQAAAAAAKAAADEAKKADEEKTAAAAAPHGGGGAAPPAAKPPPKTLHKLDSIGDDIASQLK